LFSSGWPMFAVSKLGVRDSLANGPGTSRCWLLGVSRVRSVSRRAGHTRARWHCPRSILPWASPLSGFWTRDLRFASPCSHDGLETA
jgi:hypothetical protein